MIAWEELAIWAAVRGKHRLAGFCWRRYFVRAAWDDPDKLESLGNSFGEYYEGYLDRYGLRPERERARPRQRAFF